MTDPATQHLPPADQPPSADKYESLLSEAANYKGVSLWQDAWKRLRRNYLATGSLIFLIAVAVLAFITPMLPLQSPIFKDVANRKFLAPSDVFDEETKPISLGGFKDLQFKDNSLIAELEKFNAEIAELEQRRDEATGEARKALDDQIQGKKDAAHPYGKLWHKPWWLVNAMIGIRLAVFGEWCIPSIAGTDALGRDVLARVFWGARVSLIVGIVSTMVSLVIGVSWGATAGYMGGIVDSVMMRMVDVLYSVPFIFVVILLITFLSDDDMKKMLEAFYVNRIVIFYLVIGAIYWLTMSRVVRGQVISLKNEQFVDAARVVGARTPRIIFRHLVPNVMGVVIIYLTLTIPSVMLFEAFLSFLGLGVEPPDVSWGLLAKDAIGVITPVRTYWWLVVFPGLALTLTLFALNFLGDGLRDALDPRMKNKD